MRDFKLFLSILFFLSSLAVIGQQEFELDAYLQDDFEKGINHYHISGKEEFSGAQNIHILAIPLVLLKSEYTLDLIWSDSLKYQTSTFARKSGAFAAINAGFFDVSNGGSVCYLEYGNENVAKRSWKGDQAVGIPTNLDGALILHTDGDISIERARSSLDYLGSQDERWVLVTGPVLIQSGSMSSLLENSFVDNRHPRTAIGVTKDYLFLITVDGRHTDAQGMTLPELQDFMVSLGCKEAINLDGGGSTTMWLNTGSTHGVVNCPSDNGIFDHEGERKVANVLVLLRNSKSK